VQVNVRTCIIEEGGRSKEAQTEFLSLTEDAIRQPDLAKSVQRYQRVVDQAKVRLNLAVAPMTWLMPANMIINTASAVGYNNKLKQVVSGTNLGVNNMLNTDTEKSALKLMEGGPSKINPPNSRPSNPVHKAAQDPRPQKQARFTLPSDEVGHIKETLKEPQHEISKTEQQEINKTEQHETNKTAVIIGVVGVAALLILATH